MSSDPASFDDGVLNPIAVCVSDVGDAAVVDALVTAEIALTRAWHEVGAAPATASATISDALGWNGSGTLATGHGISSAQLAEAGVAGGNPVIPLVSALRSRVAEHAAWVHRGATSQDILDSALMLLSHRAGNRIVADLRKTSAQLASLAREHAESTSVARTLTQPAVPTTLGARIAVWARAIARAADALEAAIRVLPAQLAGAGGTSASFIEIGGDAAHNLPAAFAAELALATPDSPWHTDRWPITTLGDALVRSLDALGKFATDVATGSRAEVDEFREGAGGVSSAMPQKQNPVASVLIRSAALRAPQLAATLHLASALAADERPDGAWHAEWPTLRELLRLARGAGAKAVELADGLQVQAAVAKNHVAAHPEIIAERLSIVLPDLVGRDEARAMISRIGAGENPATVLTLAGLDPALADAVGYRGNAVTLAETAGDE